MGVSEIVSDKIAGLTGAGVDYDIVVVGGGSAGLPAAIFAARRGARTLLVEHEDKLGGSLWVATGQISAAGTRLQGERGIADTPDMHFEDVMRISRGTANPEIVRLAVDNAADTFDWLIDEGFEPLPEHPVAGFGHEPYRESRYYWGAEGGITIKNVVVPIVEELAQGDMLDVMLETSVVRLVQDDAGNVGGVVVRNADGSEKTITAGAVLLSCGGYAGNPAMFAEMNGQPHYNAAPWQGSRGDGMKLGRAAGGYARGRENLFCNFGTLFNTDSFPAKAFARIEHFPERREPWEIYVNTDGQRFVREDVRSVDAREMALSMQPGQRYWIVFDQAIMDAAPPMIVDWSREQMAEAFRDGGPAFKTADTIAELAAACGMDAGRLAATIESYNYGVLTGNDFLGREHKPLPIASGPFYAIRMQASSISSAVGLAVDGQLRVVREDGSVIGNLYAAGEILGSSQTMGKAACGGMMVTPAMTFGRLLGGTMIPVGANA